MNGRYFQTQEKFSKALLMERLGMLLFKLEQYNLAEQRFKQSLDQFKKLVSGRIYLGWSYYYQDKKKEALQELRHAQWWSEKFEKYPIANTYFHLGNYWFLEHDHELATEFFKKAIQFCDASFNPYKYYIELGRTQLILKDDEAFKALEKATGLISNISVDQSTQTDLEQLINQASSKE